MLENIRENSQGLAAKIILGFIILTFAVAGIGSYTNNVDTSVAHVNDDKISQFDFKKSYDAQRNRMEQQFGEMFTTLAADANYMENFRNSVLERLINQKLIQQNADDLAIRVSDEKIKQTIRTMPEFQVDGVFNNDRYLALLQQAGFFQSSDFRDYLREEMASRQLTQALMTTEFSLPYQVENANKLQNQTRDFRFATISSNSFKDNIELTDEEISEYYQSNQARFENPEKVKVDYITLDVSLIAAGISLTDDDITTYYQENISDYTEEEQRKVSHILIEFGEDKTQAKEKITAILAKLNAGEDFATLAKNNSADTFSAENGGDLDWVELGTMDQAFDKAVLALSDIGSISDIVETEFGFHLIKLTDYKAQKISTLDEVRQALIEKAKEERAKDKFFELQQEAARLSFEYPDSLDEAADATGVKVKTSVWLTKGINAAPFNSKAAIDAVFSDLVLTEQLNSDVVELNENQAIVVRLHDHKPASVKALTEVKEQISTALISKKASEKTQQVADELLVAYKKGENIEAKLAEVNSALVTKTNVKRQESSIDANIVKKAFTMPHASEGQISAATVNLSNGDLALIELQAVKAGTEKADDNLAKQMSQQIAQAVYSQYIASLNSKADIVRRNININENQY